MKKKYYYLIITIIISSNLAMMQNLSVNHKSALFENHPIQQEKPINVKNAIEIDWNENGTLICNSIFDKDDVRLISDDQGGALITWGDRRNGKYDIYAQRIDEDGVVQWISNGIGICTLAEHQDYPRMVKDDAGGAIITWYDERSVSYCDIYAQRIDASGTILWTTNGEPICTHLSFQFDPKITADGDGGAIIAWEDTRNPLGSDIYAQKINSTGDIQWTGNGTIICNAIDSQREHQIISDGEGGAIIVWVDRRSASYADIYAQRINSTGDIQWEANGTAICTIELISKSDLQIVPDGTGGAIIAWEDYRSSQGDIYAQRIDSNGVCLWDSNGTVICNATGHQRFSNFSPMDVQGALANDDSGGAIVAWEDTRNGVEDIYAQKINSDGIIQWIENGIIIKDSDYMSEFPRLVNDGGEGAYVIWTESSFLDYSVYLQRIDSNGNIKYSTDGLRISDATDSKWDHRIIQDKDGGAIITWTDEDGSDEYIYTQSVSNKAPEVTSPGSVETTTTDDDRINWKIIDEQGTGDYRVLYNKTGTMTVWRSWTPWLNDTSLNAVIDHSTVGIFNYTIEYYDDQKTYGIFDSILVNISQGTTNDNDDDDDDSPDDNKDNDDRSDDSNDDSNSLFSDLGIMPIIFIGLAIGGAGLTVGIIVKKKGSNSSRLYKSKVKKIKPKKSKEIKTKPQKKTKEKKPAPNNDEMKNEKNTQRDEEWDWDNISGDKRDEDEHDWEWDNF